MNRKRELAVGLLLLLAVGSAEAHGRREVRARVVSVEPVYETVLVDRPETRCRSQIVERTVASPRVAGQALAGAIVGAAIGRQFGDGSGQDALTLIGAAAGSAVAHRRAVRNGGGVTVVREPVEQCTTEIRRHRESRLAGYWVEYRHRGRYHRVFTAEHPGDAIYVVARS